MRVVPSGEDDLYISLFRQIGSNTQYKAEKMTHTVKQTDTQIKTKDHRTMAYNTMQICIAPLVASESEALSTK